MTAQLETSFRGGVYTVDEPISCKARSSHSHRRITARQVKIQGRDIVEGLKSMVASRAAVAPLPQYLADLPSKLGSTIHLHDGDVG